MSIIHKLQSASFASNSYILMSNDGSSCAVIDPSVSPRSISPDIASNKFAYILLTHCHYDHMIYYEEWRNFAKCDVLVGARDLDGFDDSLYNAYSLFYQGEKHFSHPNKLLHGGERLQLGNEVIKVIATPGHTAGSVCYMVGNNLFTGDTLFADGYYGRTDLPSGDNSELVSSLGILREMAGKGITCYPGHDHIFKL